METRITQTQKEKIRFRNTIDPEFSRLRRPLNWLKPVGVVEIIHGCVMLATAVTIILSYKRTFMEGITYSARIMPNFVIGLTSLMAGIRACCIKSEVGFSLDKPALKCVVGFCCISTLVSLAMSILLICLSSTEYHGLVHNPPKYTFLEERKSLCFMNMVVSSVSALFCFAFVVVYLKIAVRIPLGSRRISVSPSRAPISVISNGGHFGPSARSNNHSDARRANQNNGYINDGYTSRESLSNGDLVTSNSRYQSQNSLANGDTMYFNDGLKMENGGPNRPHSEIQRDHKRNLKTLPHNGISDLGQPLSNSSPVEVNRRLKTSQKLTNDNVSSDNSRSTTAGISFPKSKNSGQTLLTMVETNHNKSNNLPYLTGYQMNTDNKHSAHARSEQNQKRNNVRERKSEPYGVSVASDSQSQILYTDKGVIHSFV